MPILAALACLVGFPQMSPENPEQRELALTSQGQLHVVGDLIVGWTDEGVDGALDNAVERLGGEVRWRLDSIRAAMISLPDGVAVEEAVARSHDLPGIRFAEPNGVGSGGGNAGIAPDDPTYPMQWHLENTAANVGTPGADIEVLGAWDLTTGSRSITLAVLDSGIDRDDPEFSGRCLQGFDFVNGDIDPNADHPHGIAVTALAAANTNNGTFVAGVDRACMILPVKVLNSANQGTLGSLIQGLDYTAQQGANVVNLSLINYPSSFALEAALANLRSTGAIIIASSGNSGIGNADVSYPGASEHTISMGATNPNDRRWNGSGTGAKLDFVAPGRNVRTYSGTGNLIFTGTSAAAPLACGIATLCLSLDPTIDQDQMYALFRVGAEDEVGAPVGDPPGRDDQFGWGRLNAARIVAAAQPPLRYCSPAVPNSTGVPGSMEFDGSLTATANDFLLIAENLPPGSSAYFVLGSDRDFAPGQSPHQGNVCIGGTVGRILDSLQTASPTGRIEHALDATALPVPSSSVVQPGDRWCFQAWHRDQNPTSTSNLTDALEVRFR